MEMRLKELQAQRGIIQKDFAQGVGISRPNLSHYINGDISPTVGALNRTASHLGIELTEAFQEKGNVEFYAKYRSKMCLISKGGIISIIKKKTQWT